MDLAQAIARLFSASMATAPPVETASSSLGDTSNVPNDASASNIERPSPPIEGPSLSTSSNGTDSSKVNRPILVRLSSPRCPPQPNSSAMSAASVLT